MHRPRAHGLPTGMRVVSFSRRRYIALSCQQLSVRACPSDRPAHSARLSTSSAPLRATNWPIPCTLQCLQSDSTCVHALALACGRCTSASQTAARTVQVVEMRGRAFARRQVRSPTLCPESRTNRPYLGAPARCSALRSCHDSGVQPALPPSTHVMLTLVSMCPSHCVGIQPLLPWALLALCSHVWHTCLVHLQRTS
jgi:hypothetical protein